MKIKLILLAIAVAILVISFRFYHCSSPLCTPSNPPRGALGTSDGLTTTSANLDGATMTIGSTTIHALIADTNTTREQGLSGRESLLPDTGMLFIFDTPRNYGFWMKDMRFDLDMIWIGTDKKVLAVSKNAPADSYPKIFYPPSAARYVVEVPAGFADTHHIAAGDNFSYALPQKTAIGQ